MRGIVLQLGRSGLNSRYVTAPSPQDMGWQRAKSLGRLNTEEVCRWFTGMGLQKCLPFIRGTERHLPPDASFPRPDVAPRLIHTDISSNYLSAKSLLHLSETQVDATESPLKCANLQTKILVLIRFPHPRTFLMTSSLLAICLQRPNSVELTSPQPARTFFTPSTSARWRTGSSCCRPFTPSCTLPPSSPRGWTLCSVPAHSPEHRQAARWALNVTSCWCFRRICQSLRSPDFGGGSGVHESVEIVSSRQLPEHASALSQTQVLFFTSVRAPLWFTRSAMLT